MFVSHEFRNVLCFQQYLTTKNLDFFPSIMSAFHGDFANNDFPNPNISINFSGTF